MWEQLVYDGNSGRLMWGDKALHCGQCMDVSVFVGSGDLCPSILPARLEYSDSRGWYLVGVPGMSPVGVFARL